MTDLNPYAPPASDLGGELTPASDDQPLAERGTRLAAALLDTLIYFGSIIPGFVVVVGSDSSGDLIPIGLGVMLLGWLSVVAYNAYLITISGQSIAKSFLQIRIVRMDGSPCGFLHGVLLRSWLMVLINNLFGLVGIADPLLIFAPERRCLHDYIAGTKVVVAKLPDVVAQPPRDPYPDRDG